MQKRIIFLWISLYHSDSLFADCLGIIHFNLLNGMCELCYYMVHPPHAQREWTRDRETQHEWVEKNAKCCECNACMQQHTVDVFGKNITIWWKWIQIVSYFASRSLVVVCALFAGSIYVCMYASLQFPFAFRFSVAVHRMRRNTYRWTKTAAQTTTVTVAENIIIMIMIVHHHQHHRQDKPFLFSIFLYLSLSLFLFLSNICYDMQVA